MDQVRLNVRPKSANPNRRMKTAHHPHQQVSEFVADSPEESSPSRLSVDQLSDIDETSAKPSLPTYDSLMTFECAQKASALRVLAKTLDRQRDVMQASHNTTATSPSNPSGESDSSSRKTVHVNHPRKLRPLGREYSGPF